MRYWAVQLYSLIQKCIAIFAAVSAVVAFVLVLLALAVVEQYLADHGIRFVEGTIGLAFYSFCGLFAALVVALEIYAFGQLLQVIISMEASLRSLQKDVRDIYAIARGDDYPDRY